MKENKENEGKEEVSIREHALYARNWAKIFLPYERVRKWEDEKKLPEEIIQKFIDSGIPAARFPLVYGGMGVSLLVTNLHQVEIARKSRSVSLVLTTNKLAGWPIFKFGTSEQKEKWLRILAQARGGFFLSEPTGGTWAANIGVTATQINEGKEYIIKGSSKVFITNPDGEVGVLFARTGTFDKMHKGITAFIFDPQDPRVRLGKFEDKTACRASRTCQVFFDDLEIPTENILGNLHEGYSIAMHTLGTSGRPDIAAQSLGMAYEALLLALDYAKDRILFGKPIINFDVIREEFAKMASSIVAGFIFLKFICERIGSFDHAAVSEEPHEYLNFISAVAKLYCTELAVYAAQKCSNVFGGYGYMRDYPISSFREDAGVATRYEGVNEIQREVIIRRLLNAYSKADPYKGELENSWLAPYLKLVAVLDRHSVEGVPILAKQNILFHIADSFARARVGMEFSDFLIQNMPFASPRVSEFLIAAYDVFWLNRDFDSLCFDLVTKYGIDDPWLKAVSVERLLQDSEKNSCHKSVAKVLEYLQEGEEIDYLDWLGL